MAKKLFTKPERKIFRVFIHCSASDAKNADDVKVIRKWHVEGNGWKDIGYHLFIQKNGTIQTGRDMEKTPAAQKGNNSNTIAICVHGLLKSKFTKKQIASLKKLCKAIDKEYDGSVSFHGHKEVSNKTCPVIDYVGILGLDEKGYIK